MWGLASVAFVVPVRMCEGEGAWRRQYNNKEAFSQHTI